MTIFRFIAAAGVVLLALLFVADATLAPRGPLFTNNTEGLPRSQPIRPHAAEWPQEAAGPRAPALAEMAPEQPAAPNPVAAATPVAAPLAAVAETSGSTLAGTQDKTQSPKTEPATSEPAKVAIAKLEAISAEASKSYSSKSHAAAAKSIKATPKPKMRKQAARKSARGGHYAAYRDDVPAIENGYPYGVPSRRERTEWQRPWSEKPWSEKPWSEKPWGGEFKDNPFRF